MQLVQKDPSRPFSRLWLARLAKYRVFGKSPMGTYLKLNKRLWFAFPETVRTTYPMRTYGDFLHSLTRMHADRGQVQHTAFLRNRAALQLIRRLTDRVSDGGVIKVAVLGCSTGAEAYSVAWAIRSFRPVLRLILNAVDISEQAVEIAKCGSYSIIDPKIGGIDILSHLTQTEFDQLFERIQDQAAVKSWIREGIKWSVGDASHPEIINTLGPQDIVIANNFLCHMEPTIAESTLRNIARLVRPRGYLFVSGIDLEIRTRLARELDWEPVQELLEDIHHGDPRMGAYWPFNYSSLEPLNKKRADWKIRYAQVFEL